MKMSRLGIKTQKNRGSEEALSQEILIQSSLLKRHAAGIYGMGDMVVRARNNIIEIIRKNLADFGCAEVSMPVMQPKLLWDASGRFNTYYQSKTMFITQGRNDDIYCLGPTAEEIVLDFVRNNIPSHKDLPINVFQIGLKYRDEIRTRGGLLRSKEFVMKDGYSFSATEACMVKEYENMKACYIKIFKDLGLPITPVRAMSGDMGGKVSEEFMCISPIGEDKVLFDHKAGFAINTEVLECEDALAEIKKEYPKFDLASLTEERCIELGHIFQLGTFYSQGMNGFFVNKDNQKAPYYMGCYGIGVNRVLGTICELNSDEDGISWPLTVAPYRAVVVAAPNHTKDAEKLYDILKSKGVTVVIDDRDETFGTKLKDAKLLGFPYLIIVGKEFAKNKTYEVEVRADKKKLLLTEADLLKLLKK